MIETSIYKTSPSRLGRRGVGEWLSRWWWTIALPVIVAIALSVHDWRFIIVLAALIAIAYPAVLMLVFYNYALSPVLAKNILPHKVGFLDSELCIIYFNGDECIRRRAPYSAIKKVEDCGDCMIITFRGKGEDWIEIPAKEFAAGDFDKAFALCSAQKR